MEAKVNRTNPSSFEITATYTQDEVIKAKESAIKKLGQKVRIPGFREGMAPLKLIEEQIDKNLLHRELFTKIINESYPQIIKEHHLAPIATPRINIKDFKPYEQLILTIEVAERPEVTIGDYKKEIQESVKTGDENPQDNILEAILRVTKVDVPALLVEEEAERMLSRLVDQITKVGLTLENYLKSKQQTVEQLQEEYRKGAEKTLKSELAFAKLIKEESISVSKQEIEEALAANPDENSRVALAKEENRWYIESVLARSKLLEKLMKLREETK